MNLMPKDKLDSADNPRRSGPNADWAGNPTGHHADPCAESREIAVSCSYVGLSWEC